MYVTLIQWAITSCKRLLLPIGTGRSKLNFVRTKIDYEKMFSQHFVEIEESQEHVLLIFAPIAT